MKIKSIMLVMVATGVIATPTIISANSVSNTIDSENRKLSTGDDDYTNVHWHSTSEGLLCQKFGHKSTNKF